MPETEPKRQMLERRLLEARAVLAFEWLWPLIVAAGVLAALFLAVSWLGAWVALPHVARMVGVGLFAAAFVAVLVRGIRTRRPGRRDALARLDRDSGRPPSSRVGEPGQPRQCRRRSGHAGLVGAASPSPRDGAGACRSRGAIAPSRGPRPLCPAGRGRAGAGRCRLRGGSGSLWARGGSLRLARYGDCRAGVPTRQLDRSPGLYGSPAGSPFSATHAGHRPAWTRPPGQPARVRSIGIGRNRGRPFGSAEDHLGAGRVRRRRPVRRGGPGRDQDRGRHPAGPARRSGRSRETRRRSLFMRHRSRSRGIRHRRPAPLRRPRNPPTRSTASPSRATAA